MHSRTGISSTLPKQRMVPFREWPDPPPIASTILDYMFLGRLFPSVYHRGGNLQTKPLARSDAHSDFDSTLHFTLLSQVKILIGPREIPPEPRRLSSRNVAPQRTLSSSTLSLAARLLPPPSAPFSPPTTTDACRWARRLLVHTPWPWPVCSSHMFRGRQTLSTYILSLHQIHSLTLLPRLKQPFVLFGPSLFRGVREYTDSVQIVRCVFRTST